MIKGRVVSVWWWHQIHKSP